MRRLMAISAVILVAGLVLGACAKETDEGPTPEMMTPEQKARMRQMAPQAQPAKTAPIPSRPSTGAPSEAGKGLPTAAEKAKMREEAGGTTAQPPTAAAPAGGGAPAPGAGRPGG